MMLLYGSPARAARLRRGLATFGGAAYSPAPCDHNGHFGLLRIKFVRNS
jgi:hypothetical protein